MSTERSLEIDGLSKRYGETVAVQDLGFDVHAGELFARSPAARLSRDDAGPEPIQVDRSKSYI